VTGDSDTTGSGTHGHAACVTFCDRSGWVVTDDLNWVFGNVPPGSTIGVFGTVVFWRDVSCTTGATAVEEVVLEDELEVLEVDEVESPGHVHVVTAVAVPPGPVSAAAPVITIPAKRRLRHR
jgi:hypothetical protein